MKKFVPRSHIGIFCNEHTQSTPLDPKLMFWCIAWCLGAFGIVSQLHETQCNTVCTGAINAKVRATKSRRDFFSTNTPNPLHWTLNTCFGVLHSVWVHLGSFRNYMKLDAKHGQLVQLMRKFLPRSHVGIFLYEPTQTTPLDPKLMFWCVA